MKDCGMMLYRIIPQYFESYLVIAVIYFVLCFVFDKLFKLIEKKLQGKTDYALAVEYMDNE